MGPFDEVEVRSRFDGEWTPGFEIAGAEPNEGGAWSFWVRRRSDGVVLPEPFGRDEVRRHGG